VKKKSDSQVLEEFRNNCRESLQLVLLLTPRSELLRSKMREYPNIINKSTIIWLGEWDENGFEHVSKKYFNQQNDEMEEIQLTKTKEVIQTIIAIYKDVTAAAPTYFDQTGHFVYISPRHFENFCMSYKAIMRKRKEELIIFRTRFTNGLFGIEKTE